MDRIAPHREAPDGCGAKVGKEALLNHICLEGLSLAWPLVTGEVAGVPETSLRSVP